VHWREEPVTEIEEDPMSPSRPPFHSALLLAAFLGLFFVASAAVAVPPWYRPDGCLRRFCPSHLRAKDNSDLESIAVRCTAGHGDDTYFTADGGRFVSGLVRNGCNGPTASSSAFMLTDDATLRGSFLTLGRVEKGPWGFASRASETDLTGGRVVTEAERSHKYGVYSNSVLIGFRWGF
jgi:hypothetical protein